MTSATIASAIEMPKSETLPSQLETGIVSFSGINSLSFSSVMSFPLLFPNVRIIVFLEVKVNQSKSLVDSQ